MADITCKLGGLNLRNPFVLASGIMGTSASLLQRAAHVGCGAVTAKSCGLLEREGHANPTVIDWGHGLINAIGLTNPGARAMAELLARAKGPVHQEGSLLFASIFAKTLDEFGIIAEIIAATQPDLLEVDISCPNIGDYGLPFAAHEGTAARATEQVKKAVGDLPVAIKLAPNVPDIGKLARVVEQAGANFITAINAMPGMIINARAGRPVLTNKVGGISGYALKPIALHCVAEIARNVTIPVIGVGGVSTGVDAVEMIMAGATAVGVGSAVYYRGVDVFRSLPEELVTFMNEESYPDLASMRGKAL